MANIKVRTPRFFPPASQRSLRSALRRIQLLKWYVWDELFSVQMAQTGADKVLAQVLLRRGRREKFETDDMLPPGQHYSVPRRTTPSPQYGQIVNIPIVSKSCLFFTYLRQSPPEVSSQSAEPA